MSQFALMSQGTLLNPDLLLYEMIYSYGRKFFPVGTDPHWDKQYLKRKENFYLKLLLYKYMYIVEQSPWVSYEHILKSLSSDQMQAYTN